MNTLVRGDLSSLAWIESRTQYFHLLNHAPAHLCSVYYSALNFRDIMIASGAWRAP